LSDDVQILGQEDQLGLLGRVTGPEAPNVRTRGLERIVEALSACIAEVSAEGLRETAELLAIARLDLMVRLHDISEQELAALASYLARKPQMFRRSRPTQKRIDLRWRRLQAR
jgi:hypothetical protein